MAWLLDVIWDASSGPASDSFDVLNDFNEH